MSHTALARKYRPRNFAEVATQEHVSETLRRAVAGDRVGHAYLFCGPRGVGKTTLARVLAMALNCPDRESGGEPCGQCESCTRIWSGTTALDVVEIDAASNRGVDDARDLRERAMYAPSEEGRFKVYIVDEAHMLTREAWNALLKILEEPPPRVIFIFATTEPQKIEQTAAPILSRCQRFDFHRLGVSEIVSRLEEVLSREGVSAQPEALRLLARKADGGMRDALSLTDQVLALSEGGLGVESVRRILGVVEEERFFQLFDLLAERNRAGIFELIQTLLDEGYDLVEFYHGMVEAIRTLLRLKLGGAMGDLGTDRQEEWTRRAEPFAPADLIRMLGMGAELESSGSLRRTSQPRVLLELLLLRFSYLDRTVELEALLGALGAGGALREGPPVAAPAGSGSASPGGPAASPTSTSGPARSSASRPPEPSAPPTRPPEPSAAPSRPPEPPAPPAPREASPPSPGRHEDPLRGWSAFLESGEGIPPGLSTFLRAGRVTEEGETVVLHLPEGPALERLERTQEREALSSAFNRFLATPRTLEVRKQGAEAPGREGGRISADEAREGRLSDLLHKEPGLRPAVEELDLELMD